MTESTYNRLCQAYISVASCPHSDVEDRAEANRKLKCQNSILTAEASVAASTAPGPRSFSYHARTSLGPNPLSLSLLNSDLEVEESSATTLNEEVPRYLSQCL